MKFQSNIFNVVAYLFRNIDPHNLDCDTRRWDRYPSRCIFHRVGTDPGSRRHRYYSPAKSATIRKHGIIIRCCTAVCPQGLNLMSRHHICFIARCFAVQPRGKYRNIDKDTYLSLHSLTDSYKYIFLIGGNFSVLSQTEKSFKHPNTKQSAVSTFRQQGYRVQHKGGLKAFFFFYGVGL